MASSLDYGDIKFPIPQNHYSKTKIKKNNTCINVFGYESGLVYSVLGSDKKVEDFMDLLLTTDNNVLHYVCIKYFNTFMYNKTKHRNIKRFCK